MITTRKGYYEDEGLLAGFREKWLGHLCYKCGKRFQTGDIGRRLCGCCFIDVMEERMKKEHDAMMLRLHQMSQAMIKADSPQTPMARQPNVITERL